MVPAKVGSWLPLGPMAVIVTWPISPASSELGALIRRVSPAAGAGVGASAVSERAEAAKRPWAFGVTVLPKSMCASWLTLRSLTKVKYWEPLRGTSW